VFAAGLPKERLIVTRYEDLIKDHRAVVNQIFEAMGLSFQEEGGPVHSEIQGCRCAQDQKRETG